jgi:D-alanyl-D-alanine carboxypeptidase
MVKAVGIWHWGPAPFLLRLQGSAALDLSPAGGVGRGSGFVRRADSWVGISGYWRGEPLRVVRRPDGTVSHLDIGTFVFTREPYDPTAPIPGGVSPDPWRSS